jgi:hypothetical protein
MHSPVLLLLLLLLLLVVLCRTTPPAAVAAVAAAAAAVAQPGAEDKALLEQEVSKLRVDVERQPGNAMLQLQLATALHKLNHLSPDGGRRISEAAKAYRCVMHSGWMCSCTRRQCMCSRWLKLIAYMLTPA